MILVYVCTAEIDSTKWKDTRLETHVKRPFQPSRYGMIFQNIPDASGWFWERGSGKLQVSTPALHPSVGKQYLPIPDITKATESSESVIIHPVTIQPPIAPTGWAGQLTKKAASDWGFLETAEECHLQSQINMQANITMLSTGTYRTVGIGYSLRGDV